MADGPINIESSGSGKGSSRSGKLNAGIPFPRMLFFLIGISGLVLLMNKGWVDWNLN